MIEGGVLDPMEVVRECLNYMSEDEVTDMAESVGWIDEEEEEDYGEEPEDEEDEADEDDGEGGE